MPWVAPMPPPSILAAAPNRGSGIDPNPAAYRETVAEGQYDSTPS